MRKLKFNLGEGGIKGFFIRHVEKIVLGVAVVLVAVFFCLGYSLEGLPTNLTPSALQTNISLVKAHLAKDNWDILEPGRKPEMRHPERVDEGRAANDLRGYPLASLDTPRLQQKTLRTDPRILKPLKVEVVGKTVPIAYLPASTTEYNRVMSSYGELAAAKKKPKEAGTKPKASRSGAGSVDALGGTAEVPSEGEGPSPGAVYGSGADEHRVLTPTQMSELHGVIPPDGAIAKSKFLVAIKAVVQHELQWKEFERCFSNSNEYNLARDVPIYHWLYVERAEVPTDPKAPLAWKKLDNNQLHNLLNPEVRGGWAAYAEELADPAFVDEVLTFPTPPVLLDDLKKWSLHSDVPERKELLEGAAEETPAEGTGEEGGPSRPPTGPGAPPRRGSGGPGGEGGEGRIRPPTLGSGGGFKQPGGPGPIRAPGEGGGVMGPGGESSTAELGPGSKYKLIRFYDLNVEPGKMYRYRVQVLLLDPNRPYEPSADPSVPTLDPKVLERLKAVDAKDGGQRKTFWVESEWSDPSEPIGAPVSPQKMLAGGVESPKPTILGIGPNRQSAPRFYEKEPSITVAASLWDDKKAVFAAAELPQLYRGALLNATPDVDVLHPVTRQFFTLKEYPFKTEAVLLDIRGGEPLPDSKADKEFKTPGEFLLIDKYGNLQIGDEFEDRVAYRRELYEEDVAPTAQVEGGGQGIPIPSYSNPEENGPRRGKAGEGGSRPGPGGPGPIPGGPGKGGKGGAGKGGGA